MKYNATFKTFTLASILALKSAYIGVIACFKISRERFLIAFINKTYLNTRINTQNEQPRKNTPGNLLRQLFEGGPLKHENPLPV